MANTDDGCELLTRKEAADYLKRRWKQRVSAQTLANYASDMKGPPYQITDSGSDALYLRQDLDIWARGRLLPGRVVAGALSALAAR